MKKEGFLMSIRALSPKVIISDELGSKDDFEIIQYALKSGVNIITTAHGSDIDDVKKNIYLKNIIENHFFDRILILDSIKKGLNIKQIIDITGNKVIYDARD
jgi:stage III sporulation protein AA